MSQDMANKYKPEKYLNHNLCQVSLNIAFLKIVSPGLCMFHCGISSKRKI